MLDNNIDVLCFAESKLDSSFPESQFFLPGYRMPYRFDVSNHSGGLLLYVKETIPSKLLTKFNLPTEIQAIPIEINIRKTKWLIVALYRPERTNKMLFIDIINNLLDYYCVTYDNLLIMGDFNMLASDMEVVNLINNHDLHSMIKVSTCFKSTSGRCIDLLLTNKKHNFFNTQTLETGFSDFHVMLYTMLKSTYQKLPPKVIRYRSIKNICNEKFVIDLKANLIKGCIGDYDLFEKTFQQVLDNHAPYKTKIARGNDKPFMNKQLRK